MKYMRHTPLYLLLGIALALCYWLVETLLHFFFFNPALVQSHSFMDAFFPVHDINEFMMRISIAVLMLISAYVIGVAVKRLDHARQQQSRTFESYRDFINKSTEGILAVDMGGSVVFFNPAAGAMLGSRLSLGSSASITFAVGKITEMEIEHVGEVHTVEVRATATEWEHQPVNLIWLRDITASKQTERMLINARTAAEEANRAKSGLLSTMQHELRTPLNGIIGFSGLLLDGTAGELNERQREFVVEVEESAHHLLNLIKQVLDLAMLDAGELKLACETFSLQEAIASSMRQIESAAIKKHVRLVHPHDFDIDLCADIRRFRQILLCLLDNAVKFTPEGGTVSVAAKITDEGLPAIKSAVEISVSDTGIGISAEDQKKLFLPFHQTDSSLGRKYGGIGIGLALCKGLVALHGGSILVKSELGKGSVFTFFLPLNQDNSD